MTTETKERKGAYDKHGHWWHENDIKTFTGGMIRMFFGKEREQIKIVGYNKKQIK